MLLFDNFDTENGGVGVLNYSGFANFNVANAGSGGAIDLIDNGFFDYPGNGLYVDICGSESTCGVLTTKQTFGPGTYRIAPSIGGNAREDGTNATTVSFGSFSDSCTLTRFQTAVETATVVLTSASQLSIGDQGLFGPDVGNICSASKSAASRSRQPEG